MCLTYFSLVIVSFTIYFIIKYLPTWPLTFSLQNTSDETIEDIQIIANDFLVKNLKLEKGEKVNIKVGGKDVLNSRTNKPLTHRQFRCLSIYLPKNTRIKFTPHKFLKNYSVILTNVEYSNSKMIQRAKNTKKLLNGDWTDVGWYLLSNQPI